MEGADRHAPIRAADHLVLLGLVVALGFAVRAAYVLSTRHGFILFGDPADFDRCAWSIAQGHGYCTSLFAGHNAPSAFRPPGYPFLLAAVYWTLGHDLTAARLLAAVLGGASAGLAALLALHVTRLRSVALCSGALVAVAPSLVAISGAPLSENLFITLALSIALLLITAQRRPRLSIWGALGVLCGLAALTRSVGILLLVAVAWAIVTRRSDGRRATLTAVAAVLVGLAVALTPWLVRDAVVFGRIIPLTTQGGYTMVGTFNTENAKAGTLDKSEPNFLPQFKPLLYRDDISEPAINDRESAEAFKVFRSHPWFDVRVTIHHIAGLFYLDNQSALDAVADTEMAVSSWLRGWLAPTTLLLVALAAAGLTLLVRAKRSGLWVVWAIPLLCVGGVAPLTESPRYRIPIDPFLCVLAAFALVRAGQTVAVRLAQSSSAIRGASRLKIQ